VAVSLHQLLKTMTEMSGTDLHVTTNSAPQIRVDGKLRPLDLPALTAVETKQLAYSVLTDAQKHRFEESLELDFSFGIKGLARFRANVFMQRGAVAAVYRTIPYEIRGFKDLGLPPVVAGICDKPRGLVLVTGPTGSGKSTTLAAVINLINETKNYHIITIEDPIEFVHPNRRCLIHQREIGSHATSFSEALKAAGREDPDLILVGEMRDLETIQMALAAAEKGTIVFGTLHTNNAAKTCDRIISVFPSGEQEGIRAVLGETLRAVVAQQLIPKVGGGRVAAIEILFSSPAIGNMIREGKTPQITSAIQTGIKEGMIDMDSSIRKLYDEKKITARAAVDKAIDKSQFKDLIESGAASAPQH